MLKNIQEFYNILPLVIIGTGIVISLCVEIFSDKSRKIIPWFSVLLFLTTAFYASSFNILTCLSSSFIVD